MNSLTYFKKYFQVSVQSYDFYNKFLQNSNKTKISSELKLLYTKSCNVV